jgi:hypothetical protein
MKTIVLLMCGKNKLSHKAEARDIYTSPRFKKSIEYAKMLTGEESIFVLSALHGVVNLDTVIAPYDKSIYQMSPDEKTVWAEMVFTQLSKCSDVTHDKYAFLTDDDYCEQIYPRLSQVEMPLKGKKPEDHLAWFEDKINKNRG